jgi:hypothetical protein
MLANFILLEKYNENLSDLTQNKIKFSILILDEKLVPTHSNKSQLVWKDQYQLLFDGR